MTANQFSKGTTLDILHRGEWPAASSADIENRDEVRVSQVSDGAGVTLESLSLLFVVRNEDL